MSRYVCRVCQSTIRWIQMESGKAMPVEPVPDLTGIVCARKSARGGYTAGYVIGADRPARAGFTRFVPHWASCDMKPRKPEPRPLTLF